MVTQIKTNMIPPAVMAFLEKNLKKCEHTVLPLAGDASARKYYRVVCGEQSWVLMEWEPFEDNEKYPFLSVLEHFSKNKIHVPKVEAKDSGLGLVLLQDLGDLTLERKFWENPTGDEVSLFYKLTIDELVKIHSDATKDKSDCVAFGVAFDHEKLMWEMSYAKKHMIQKFCGIQMGSAVERELDSELSQLCQFLANQPRVICHRDFHSRNVMIRLGKTFVIDFQDARMGPVQYDLVSLLKDSYVDLDSKISDELLFYYANEMNTRGNAIKLDEEFRHVYEMQSVQRCFKACGSFSSFYNDRQDVRYLKYLKKTMKRVVTSLKNVNRFPTLLDVIESNGLTERTYESA